MVKFLRELSPRLDSFSFISMVLNKKAGQNDIQQACLLLITELEIYGQIFITRNQCVLHIRYLLLSSLQDSIDVFVSDFTLLGGENVSGAMPNDGQHLVLSKLVHAGVYQPT